MKTWNCLRPRVEELEVRLVPATLSNSTNWSGYAVNTPAGAVSQVAGNWVVPAVSTSVSGYSSAWVGIDGWSSSTVEQIGTDSDYVNGRAQYYAWYEMYPAGSVNLGLPINPGDTISASVTNTVSSQFVLSITDVTTGGSFATTQTSSQAQRSSAEWIQEAPSSIFGVLPLANFGTIKFSNANATVSGTHGPADNTWAGSTLYQINMVTSTGTPKATTSALSDSGSPSTSSFSVTWNSSGSGGHHGGHHSADAPPPVVPTPVVSQPSSLLSPAVLSLAARPLATPPALVATTPFPLVTVAPPAGGALPTPPAPSAASATFAPSGTDAASPAGQASEGLNRPELLPPPSEAPVPGNPDATPQNDRTPALVPGASREMGRSIAPRLEDGFRVPAPSLEGARGALDESVEGRDVALVGLALGLALDRTWTSPAQRPTGKPDGRGRGRLTGHSPRAGRTR